MEREPDEAGKELRIAAAGPAMSLCLSFLFMILAFILVLLGIILMLNGNYINGIWLVLIGLFINQSFQSSYKSTIISDIFSKIRIREFMTDKVIAVDNIISVRELVDKYFYEYKFSCFQSPDISFINSKN
jgi:hypothetical protein